MKKLLFYVVAAIAMLSAASCQKEVTPSVEGGNAVVTLSVVLPDVPQTKAIAQAEMADIVYFEVWNSDLTKKLDLQDSKYPGPLYSAPVKDRKANIELTLVADQTYNFIFWAQNERCGAYTVTDLKNVKVDYSVMEPNGNDDVYDAFYAVEPIKVNGTVNQTVTLYRPFAQLNFATERMSTSFGPVDLISSEVSVTGLATSFNTVRGIGEGKTDKTVTFKANGLATTAEKLETNGGSYTWLTMDYMFMAGDSDLVAVDASFDLGMEEAVKHSIANVPLKKNFRTNIIGDVFAADARLQIIIDKSFLKKDEDITVGVPERIDPVGDVYNVEKPGHILWLSQVSQDDPATFVGKTINFTADIDMMGQGFLPINIKGKNWTGKSATILGNGHKVFNFSVRGDSYRVGAEYSSENAGLFGELKGNITDLHVEDVLVEGNYSAGALVGYIYGNVTECSATDVVINSIPYASIVDGTFIYDDGNNVGGLIGYVGEDSYVISDNEVKNATLTGYRCIGGIVGTVAANNVVNGNEVSNSEIIVDQSYSPYVEENKKKDPAYAGEIVGRMLSTDDLSDNTATDVVITYANTVSASDELQAAVDAAATSTWIRLATDFKGDLTISQKEGVDLVIDGAGNKFDGTIYLNGHSRFNGTETLVIKNVNFESATVVDFISSNDSQNGVIRYAHNVTVEDCSFVGTAADAVAIRTRQAYNISVKNCTAKLGHSFAQLTSTSGFNAENVTVEAPRGFNLGNSNTEVTFTDCSITATKGDGYGIRFDNGSLLNVSGSDISAFEPIVFRNNKADCEFNLSSSTLTASSGYHVVVASGAAPKMTGVDGLNIKQ